MRWIGPEPAPNSPDGSRPGPVFHLVAPLAVAVLAQMPSLQCALAQTPARFAVATRSNVGQAPGSLVLADLNRDGHLDIIVANERSNSLTVLLGDGIGRFTEAPGSPVPAGQMPNDITVTDFDGTGRPDLAIANHETDYLTVLLGDGRGGFRPAPGSPVRVRVRPHPHGVAAADVNGDGHPDIVTDGLKLTRSRSSSATAMAHSRRIL